MDLLFITLSIIISLLVYMLLKETDIVRLQEVYSKVN